MRQRGEIRNRMLSRVLREAASVYLTFSSDSDLNTFPLDVFFISAISVYTKESALNFISLIKTLFFNSRWDILPILEFKERRERFLRIL